ncbi:GatB/YqeY domain-containing protein [Patescibacteria group bacterium]|nr:GatB/YqeY domain-containing protein [Patescibacteria group bacterium]
MLLKKIEQDFRQAIQKRDVLRLAVLRGLKTALHNKEIELKFQKKEMTEEIVIEIVQKEAKKRREAAEMYKKGERKELADKEEKELSILNQYLPEQLSDDKIKEIVIKVIKAVNPAGPQDFGKVMGKVMAEAKGQAQGNKVREIVQKQLNNFNHGQKK